MTPTSSLATLNNLQPIAWLILLLALYVGGKRRFARQQQDGIGPARADEAPPNYQPLACFAAARLVGTLSHPVLDGKIIPLPLTPSTIHSITQVVDWGTYLVSVACVFFLIPALLRNALRTLTDLESACLVIYRWIVATILCIAVAAHLPALGTEGFHLWLQETGASLAVCVWGAAAALLALLLLKREKLGMWVQSRSVLLTLGLVAISSVDLLLAAASRLSQRYVGSASVLEELGTLFTLALWTTCVMLPEPARRPFSLSGPNTLPKWNEYAARISEKSRPGGRVPQFISGVEIIVEGVLEKHGIGPLPERN